MRSNKFKRFPFLYYLKNMIYFTDIYGLYSLMVVMLFECELRLVRWFSVIGRYCHDISNWDEKRKILSREHYKKGTESDCYLLNLINGVQWLWGGHRRTRTVKDRTALSRSCPTGQTDRQRTAFFQGPDRIQTADRHRPQFSRKSRQRRESVVRCRLLCGPLARPRVWARCGS